MRRGLTRPLIVVATILIAAVGCNSEGYKKRPPMGKVYGVVTYKGNPVSQAIVTFTMEGMPRGASGMSDDDGRFKLTTYDTNDGAFVGTHKVIVTKASDEFLGKAPDELSPEDLEKMVKAGTVGQNLKKKSEIPSKYADLKTSPLKFTIDAGSNEKNIELED